MFRKILARHWLTLLGVILGAVGGFIYWKTVGCSSENHPTTSSPIGNCLWGAAIGGLLFSMFKIRIQREE